MKRLILGLFVLAMPAVVQAQAVTSVQMVIAGGVSPVTNLIPIAAIQCGQTPPSGGTGTVNNPSQFTYTDPADATKACVYHDPGTGPLLSLPFGGTTYTATIAFVNSVGAGPVSNVSNPFARPGTPPTVAPAALKVGP